MARRGSEHPGRKRSRPVGWAKQRWAPCVEPELFRDLLNAKNKAVGVRATSAAPFCLDAVISRASMPLGAGEIRVANTWLSVDPYMRGRMNHAKSYAEPFQLGEPMQGGALGIVTKGRIDGFSVGDKTAHKNVRGSGKSAPMPVSIIKLAGSALPDEGVALRRVAGFKTARQPLLPLGG